MFNIAVQTGGLEEIVGVDGAYRMIKEAGFDAVDANIDHLFGYGDIQNKVIPPVFAPGVSEKDMLEYVKPWRDAAKKYGLENYQAHAPFPSLHTADDDDEEWNDFLIEMLKKTLRMCAEIDCHNLVIHPFFKDYDHRVSRDTEWEVNIDRYSRLAKTARDYDVTINLENMFAYNKGKCYAAICNDGKMAAAYIDALNEMAGEKRFAFCLDVGHAQLVGKDLYEFMTEVGSRINCFHVHDNDGVADLHRQPYSGTVDWNRFVKGLKDIGFNKTLSFETFNAIASIDFELAPQMLSYIAATGRMFSRRAEE